MTTQFIPTDEQKRIINAELKSQRVVACAGSGKTATAVRRLIAIRKELKTSRVYVALFSYSNIAIESFRSDFAALAGSIPYLSTRVLMSTIDSFIATHIMLPHAHRVMGCGRQPFLVNGNEPFLQGYKVYNGSHNVDIRFLRVNLNDKGLAYSDSSFPGSRRDVSASEAERAIAKLGKIGAYTHEIARYWALKALFEDPKLSKILARRYPFVLVDEAQDIGSMHGALLVALQGEGSIVSLIGDVNQSIYEFADADGRFLREFEFDGEYFEQALTRNRRSVQAIVDVANKVCGTSNIAVRTAPTRTHGAYFMRYSESDLEQIVRAFSTILASNGYSCTQAAVLCRGRPLMERLLGASEKAGRGATERFASAAVFRDRIGDITEAFETFVDGFLRLVEGTKPALRHDILNSSTDAHAKQIRRLVWKFLKSRTTGLPAATLKAKTEWLPLLRSRLNGFLSEIKVKCGLSTCSTWTNRVTAADLNDDPLWNGDLFDGGIGRIPIKTVHRAKGETIGAVMYVAKAKDVKNLLAGPATEEGRIGYVAITRASDLLIVAIPKTASTNVVSGLIAKGFKDWHQASKNMIVEAAT